MSGVGRITILENSDSVLILGKDSGPALDRLKRIASKLEELGYYTYIIRSNQTGSARVSFRR